VPRVSRSSDPLGVETGDAGTTTTRSTRTFGSGKVVYDGAKARARFDAANAVSACHRTGAHILHLDPNCTSIFTGTVLANRLDGIALAVDPGELSIP
jgi:hypothetical protein